MIFCNAVSYLKVFCDWLQLRMHQIKQSRPHPFANFSAGRGNCLPV